jgi:3-deoxy-D-manno-octulosonate 8-phosphate phosphatase (KDO 8-P phosphatase)
MTKKEIIKKKYALINTIITDVDGVLTDGKFYYSEEGKILKKFGPHDSDGIKMLKNAGVSVKAITADKRGFKITQKRIKDMGLEIELVTEQHRYNWFVTNFNSKTTAFVGDGIFDTSILDYCDISFAPVNAIEEALKACKKKLKTKGGEGVFLEVARIMLNKIP